MKIDGLASRPELNGTEGLAVAFDEAKGRYNVKLDADGGMMALKPTVLVVAAEPEEAAAAPGSTPIGTAVPNAD